VERIKKGDYLEFTLGLLLLGTILVILYDILPAVSTKLGDTISEQTALWSLFVAFIPAGCGVLSGHLFGPQLFRTPWQVTVALAVYGAGLIACAALGVGQPRHHWVVTCVFIFHFFVGSVAWSQGPMPLRLPDQYRQLFERFNPTPHHEVPHDDHH
jgi:undecaprenyl pyrophosphate phosphatase UppP